VKNSMFYFLILPLVLLIAVETTEARVTLGEQKSQQISEPRVCNTPDVCEHRDVRGDQELRVGGTLGDDSSASTLIEPEQSPPPRQPTGN
jgi:hypothetical protein